MTITEGIEQRRSIRKYTEQEVEREKIEEVLRAALLAPSGKNRQPWKYLVYQSEEKEKLLDEMEKGLNRENTEKPYCRSRVTDFRVRFIHCVSCGRRRFLSLC